MRPASRERPSGAAVHPRTWLVACIATILLAFTPWHRLEAPYVGPSLPAAAFALQVAVALSSGRAALGTWALRLAVVIGPFALSLVLVQGLFFPGGVTPVLELGPVAFTREGLAFAAVTLGRVLVATGAVLLLFVLTRPEDVVLALEERGLPREIGYALLAALSLLPIVRRRAAAVRAAQSARGLRLDGGIRTRARSLLPLVTPLLLGVIHEAGERSLTLEGRAFRTRGPRTSLREFPDSPRQSAARRSALALAVALFALAHLTW